MIAVRRCIDSNISWYAIASAMLRRNIDSHGLDLSDDHDVESQPFQTMRLSAELSVL